MSPARIARRTLLVLALLTGLLVVRLVGVATLSAGATTTSTNWGDAIAIPGLASLGATESHLLTVSCWSPGNCVAGGNYRLTDGRYHALFVDQVNGVWGDGYEVPGSWNFDGDNIQRSVDTISCAPDGGCVAAGTYATGRGTRTFVDHRIGGVWMDAQELPNSWDPLTIGEVYPRSSACSSDGNCSIVGWYMTTPGGDFIGYISDLDDGVWQDVIDVPGLVALSTGAVSVAQSVSCPADGECSSVGTYRTTTELHTFVTDRTAGVWGSATDVPGLTSLGMGTVAESTTISCASVGDCSVGGTYLISNNPSPIASAFVADRVAGVWNGAQSAAVPGADASAVLTMSCSTEASCSAMGWLHVAGDSDPNHHSLFTIERAGGTWSAPLLLPGLDALNTADDARVVSLSCSAPGLCAATGYYTDDAGKVPFVANSSDGVWDAPVAISAVPGPSAMTCTFNLFYRGCASGFSVVCSSRTVCTAVGESYPGGVGRGFLVDFVVPPEPEPEPEPVDPVGPSFTG